MCAHVYRYPERPEASHLGIIDSNKPLMWVLEPDPDPLKEQYDF